MPANCDGRYPHYLTRLEQRDGPNTVLCIGVSGELTPAGKRSDELVETLTQWAATELIRSDGRLRTRHVVSGQDDTGLWDLIASRCRHIGTVWVVSYQCSRIWALTGLWSRLESGDIRVAGGDYRAVLQPDEYGVDASPGLLIAEDPPCLALLRIGHLPGRILWLDVRNWGIELPDTLVRCGEIAGNLASLVATLDNAVLELSLGQLSPTAAGQSYRIYRTSCMDTVPHCHVQPRVLELEHDAHIGGRCECYYIGAIGVTAYHLDIRSCYGSVMTNRLLPTRLVDYMPPSASGPPGDAMAYANCIASVDICTDERAYPVRRDTDTIYPIGRYTTVLCGPELVDAVYYDRVVWVNELARYEMAEALRTFASMIYGIRNNADMYGDTAVSSWAKYVLNGIVGKLAQRCKRWEVVPGAIAPEPWGEWQYLSEGGELQRWRAMAGVVQQEIHGGYAPDAVPAMAAFICSYGRMMLLDVIRCAGWRQVYYVDTDGVIVSEDGYRNLRSSGWIADGQLGRLELRGKSDNCEIRGIKYYLEGDDVRCAGTTRGISVRSADGRGQWLISSGAAGARMHGVTGYRRRLQRWPAPPPYRHGILQSDGTVAPHKLGERTYARG